MPLLALAIIAYCVFVALPLFCACVRAGMADDVVFRSRPVDGGV
ncbi:MAG TPA: hypothetical protein VIG57_06830 [Candidatus Entotheonella sp.]|jgi:hypothetical protein